MKLLETTISFVWFLLFGLHPADASFSQPRLLRLPAVSSRPLAFKGSWLSRPSRKVISDRLSKTLLHSVRREYESSNGGTENGKTNADIKESEKAGLLVLLTVPLAWGTYVPCVRYLYEIQPPIPGFVFSACYYALASVTLLALATLPKNDSPQVNSKVSNVPSPLLSGGLELGAYLFLGNGLQVLGLKTVPSDRAGFLVQLTTVMVPLAEALFAGTLLAIPAQTWIACLLAFTGVVVMGLDGQELSYDNPANALATSVGSLTNGDLLILGAAVMYTLHVVRLGRYAQQTRPIELAASKATTEAVLSLGLVLALVGVAGAGEISNGLLLVAKEMGQEIMTFFQVVSENMASGGLPSSVLLPAVGATVWTAWVTCAYTIYAQSFGQKRVKPTDANLIYTIQPIFTAIFAWILLGETLGPAGLVGGSFIGAAVYLVAARDSGFDKTDLVNDEANVENQMPTDEDYVSGETNVSIDDYEEL